MKEMVIMELVYRVSEKEGADLSDEQCDDIIDTINLSDINDIVLTELRKIVPFPDKVQIERV